MRVVFSTCPVKEAEGIVKYLLEKELVACVNIISSIQSHYVWKGEVCIDKESLLIMKTTEELFEELSTAINEIHSYETVEIISFEIKEGDKDYLKWIGDVTKNL